MFILHITITAGQILLMARWVDYKFHTKVSIAVIDHLAIFQIIHVTVRLQLDIDKSMVPYQF